MNISQPIPSAIGSVDFTFLTSTEIKSLSVKRIQNATTFDTLLHPIPGGLYDPALGAFGDNRYAHSLEIHTNLLTITAAQHAISKPIIAPGIQAISACRYLYIILYLWTRF
jgi:hypothetical protein